MVEEIRERIVLDGDRQFLAALRAIGDAGRRSMEEIEKAADVVGKSLDNLAVRAEVLGAELKQTGRNLSLYVTAPLVGLGAVAVKTFGSIEEGLLGVQKTTNLSNDDLADLTKRLQTMAQTTAVSINALLGIAQAAGQLGVKGVDNIEKFTATVGKLTIATDLVGDQASAMIARILTVTGTPLEEVDRFGSAIVALGNNFAATESEILEVATRVAQGTAQFKVSVQDVLGISTALKSIGVQAENAGSVVGRVFQALNDDIRAGGSALQALTGQTFTLADFQKSSITVFNEFIAGLGRVAKRGDDVTAALKPLGLEGIRVEQVLGTIANRSEVLNRALVTSNEAFKENIALEKEVAVFSQGINAQLTVLSNRAKLAAAALGEALVPAVKVLSAFLGELFDLFTALPFPVRAVIATLLGLVAAIGPLLIAAGFLVSTFGRVLTLMAAFPGTVALVTRAFVGLVTVFTNLGTIFTAVRAGFFAFGAAAASLPILLIALAAALGFIAVYLTQNSDLLVEWLSQWKDTIQGIGETLSQFVAFFVDIWNTITGIPLATWQAMQRGADAAIAYLDSVWAGFRDRMIDYFTEIKKFVIDVWNSIQTKVADIFGGGEPAQSRAGGGLIHGPGGPTDDKVPLWGSPGEFMVRARAVRHYGVAFMNALNSLRLNPDMLGMHMGGLVMAPASSTPRMRFAEGGLIERPGNTLNLSIDGQQFNNLRADDQTMDRLTRFATQKKVSSAGRKPTWKK